MTLSIDNINSIIDLAFFILAFVVSIPLACPFPKTFRCRSGWLELVELSVIHIIGSGMQVYTFANSYDSSYFIIGDQTLQYTGLSLLILTMRGLLMRVYQSIPEHSRPYICYKALSLARLFITVGLFLVYGAGYTIGSVDYDEYDSYTIPAATDAGIALFIVGYVLVIGSGAIIAPKIRMSSGEMRLLMALGAASPMVLVRLVYASISAFDASNEDFIQYDGSHKSGYYVLGMCTVMEITAVAILEAVGLTLPYTDNQAIDSEPVGIDLKTVGNGIDTATSQPLDTVNGQGNAASETADTDDAKDVPKVPESV